MPKIQILSHRGYWKTPAEKNTRTAFERSFNLDFGTETDIRDCNGRVVISHDPPRDTQSELMGLEEFLILFKAINPALPLALNVKADGLQSQLLEALARHNLSNYFVFDMSIPDTLGWRRLKAQYFVRQSEYEPTPDVALLHDSAGVWLDCFQSEWYTDSLIESHLQSGKRVCLVSPDLHKRPHLSFWERLKKSVSAENNNLLLCTDFPEDARAFFHA